MSTCQGWFLGPKPHQKFDKGPLVHISNTDTAKRLGCPVSTCSCFFNFIQPDQKGPKDACSVQFHPLAADDGRPWCICTLVEPDWLRQELPKPWKQVKRALIMGTLAGETLGD